MSTQLVVGVAGLVASSAAALLAFLNYRRQARIRIAEFRREWIEELRSDLATVFAFAVSDPDKMEIAELKTMQSAHFRIELRLNENENDHKELLEMLRTIIGLQAEREQDTRSKVIALAHQKSRKILRDEWLRLKSEIANWR